MFSLLLLALIQEAPLAAEPTIVVTGQARTDAQIRDEAKGFVRAVAAAPGVSDQLGRWNQPVCVKVLGGTPAEEAMVIDRIRVVATDAGIRLAKRKSCAPNLLVAFTHEPGNVVGQVLARRPHTARSLAIGSRNDLVQGTYPVRWWYDLKLEGRSGEAAMGDHPALLNSLDTPNNAGAAPGGGFAQSEHQSGNVADFSSSLIGSKSRQSIGAATVIVDVNRVRGRTPEALASYIAMVALAPIKLPPRPVPMPTITNLFHGAAAERAIDLSEWDRAYIAALYKTAANRAAKVQSASMTDRIARTMRGEQ